MDVHFIVVFNTDAGEVEDDIGIGAAVGVLPHDVLVRLFKVPESVFAGFPKYTDRLVMVSRK